MKLGILKAVLFVCAFQFIATFSYAEDVATYSGTKYTGCQRIGDTRIFLNNPNDYGTIKDGFIYLPEGCRSLPNVPEKYLKVINGSVEKMTRIEKDSVDTVEALEIQAQKDLAYNAIVDQAKVEVDSPSTVSALLNTCISAITTDEIRNIKKNTPKPSKTDAELKNQVKSCLDSFKK